MRRSQLLIQFCHKKFTKIAFRKKIWTPWLQLELNILITAISVALLNFSRVALRQFQLSKTSPTFSPQKRKMEFMYFFFSATKMIYAFQFKSYECFFFAVSNRKDFFLCIEFCCKNMESRENLRSFLLPRSSMSNFKNIRNKVEKSVLRSSQLNKLFLELRRERKSILTFWWIQAARSNEVEMKKLSYLKIIELKIW